MMHPFPTRKSFYANDRRVLEAIYTHILSCRMQKKEPVSKFSCMCQDHQPSCEAICQMRSSGVSLLYIKQLHTPPGVSCCQPLFLHILIHLLTKLEKTSLSLRMGFLTKFMLRLRLHSLSVQCLSLTLFVLRVLTDYSDTTFSSNNFAFFTNWFN